MYSSLTLQIYKNIFNLQWFELTCDLMNKLIFDSQHAVLFLVTWKKFTEDPQQFNTCALLGVPHFALISTLHFFADLVWTRATESIRPKSGTACSLPIG